MCLRREKCGRVKRGQEGRGTLADAAPSPAELAVIKTMEERVRGAIFQ
jgi:hypothetical protein